MIGIATPCGPPAPYLTIDSKWSKHYQNHAIAAIPIGVQSISDAERFPRMRIVVCIPDYGGVRNSIFYISALPHFLNYFAE
jgi:hypothetical protein